MPRVRVLIGLALAGLGSATAAFAQEEAPGDPEPEPPANEVNPVNIDGEAYQQIEVLMRAFETVREHFVEEEKVSYDRLVESALEGMFRRLDEHSQYLTPRLLEEMRNAGKNPDNSAGLMVEESTDGIVVSGVSEGGPAARAGVRIGDRLLAVDGKECTSLSPGEVRGALDGEPGTLLTLELLGPGDARSRTVGYRREQPVRETVTGAQILPVDLAGEGAAVGYLRVRSFSEPTVGEATDAMANLVREGAAALVLDLRANPGGLLSAGVGLCGQFLAPGTLVAKAEGRPGSEHNEEFRTAGRAPLTRTLPLAILVDGDSASSSEVVAGALKDHGRALIVGETTYGKGSVQTIVQMGLDTGAAMRLTTARFVTPNGHQIDGVGVAPHINAKGDELPITTAARALREQLKKKRG